MNSSWLARHYIDKVKENPNWKLADIMQAIKNDFALYISKIQAYRACKKAIELLDGSHHKQFNRVWDYSATLLKTNLGSTVQVLTETLPMPRALPIFRRMYCLVHALAVIAPTAEHRFCIKYLYGNLDKRYKGKQLKDAMWDATKSSTESEWNSEMNKIKEIPKGAYAFLMESDYLLNNMCETFNGYILKARDKPIITLVEMVRQTLMTMMTEKREGMIGYRRPICPKIQGKVEKLKSQRNPPVQPPSQRRPPGRPKNLRKREVDEPQNPFKLRRKNKKIKCSRCQKYGHNKTICKGEVARKGKLQVRKKAASRNGAPSTQSSGVGSSSRVTNTVKNMAPFGSGGPSTQTRQVNVQQPIATLNKWHEYFPRVNHF
ncbi:hypothetical protein L1049_015229 [Liquidambar formosana]|uniref:Uncharacterized protein n=1 Tax=Liquidambar formosana TaxID=63359 RepID=A0AAP0WZL1_LIQFO